MTATPGSPPRLDTLARVVAFLHANLAKTADERYQTAAGLARDLRRCLADWDALGEIGEFPLAEHDTPDRLRIPEKLYGREREVAALLAAFELVLTTGRPELLLVAGYSGVGKSAFVNELCTALVPQRGLEEEYRERAPRMPQARA